MSPPPTSELGDRPVTLAPPAHDPEDDGSAEPSSTIRVALADDRALVRQGLRILLGHERDIEVIAGTGDLSSPVGQLAAHRPDVLVLDLGVPSGSALAAISGLRERAPTTEIVVLSGEREPVFAQRALAAGARGFVAKQAAESELPTAIRAAARGERFVSSSVAAALDSTRRTLTEDRLTTREIEVLRLIALGHTSAEVARTLALSPRTVETHRARIHKKLGLATRAELVSYALRRRCEPERDRESARAPQGVQSACSRRTSSIWSNTSFIASSSAGSKCRPRWAAIMSTARPTGKADR
jgi:two-component system, NarL family, response regulator NreC